MKAPFSGISFRKSRNFMRGATLPVLVSISAVFEPRLAR
jgi:hypothetical protein